MPQVQYIGMLTYVVLIVLSQERIPILIRGAYWTVGGGIIGNNVDIAQETNIWTEQHDYNSPTYKPVCKEVIIEDYVWLASRVTVLPGVHIGRGAVVASGAVVTKDVSPLAIVAGVPAIIIGYRKEEALQYHLGDIACFK